MDAHSKAAVVWLGRVEYERILEILAFMAIHGTSAMPRGFLADSYVKGRPTIRQGLDACVNYVYCKVFGMRNRSGGSTRTSTR
jgi:hypothetical protein